MSELAALADPCGLASEFAQVEDTLAADHTTLDNFDFLNVGGVGREDTLDTHVVGDLADREGGSAAFANSLNANALELLDTLLVAFLDAHVDVDGVACAKFGEVIPAELRLDQSYKIVHLK